MTRLMLTVRGHGPCLWGTKPTTVKCESAFQRKIDREKSADRSISDG